MKTLSLQCNPCCDWRVLYLLVFLLKSSAYAGVQIATIDRTQVGTVPTTNCVIAKIDINAVRVDIGSAVSVITLPAASEEIQLFHKTKTYQWQATNPDFSGTNPPPPLPLACETTFDGFPAKLFCLTNGAEYSHKGVSSRY